MKKVQILLSTYNGEKYLKEQLDSLLNQSYKNISILIRDDGSTDGTVDIIEKYAKQYSQISFYKGNNLGVVNSFFDLVKRADMSCDYFAFSDQDDVWNLDKISHAVYILNKKQKDKALLYCGRTTLVNCNLEKINTNIKVHNVVPSFGNAIVENVCIGCTSVVNKVLLQLVQEHVPDYTVMHDWWFYLTASCFGEVSFDNQSYIFYRQHDNNVMGTRATYCDEFKNRIKNFKKNRGKIRRQLEEFIKLYKVDGENSELIKYVICSNSALRYRFKILFSDKIYRQRRIDNIIFKLLFITGKL